jgi:general stress protein YciG
LQSRTVLVLSLRTLCTNPIEERQMSDKQPDQNEAPKTKSDRGFASMDRDKQREIASKGGKAAHAKGTAHEFNSAEAALAGHLGGKAVSRNREHMAAIGRRGGEARGKRRNQSGGGVGF